MLNTAAARSLTEQHSSELRTQVAECRRTSGHFLPRWHVSWSRARLSPASAKGSSLVIIISASRTA
ncbi:MAG TPA: hypothetical protein VGG16_02725 [Streptosporangiaceae bacterium]|jgi:hypothetical protein